MSDPDDRPVITAAEVAHVAGLARLSLIDSDLERFTHQLADILAHAKDMAALDTSGVEPMAHPYPLRNVLREDIVTTMIDRDEVLAAAPDIELHQFKVPPVLGDAP